MHFVANNDTNKTNDPNTPIATGSLNLELHDCAAAAGIDKYGYKINGNATCSTCDLLCNQTNGTTNINDLIVAHEVLEGFNLNIVFIVLGIVVAETVVFTLFRYFKK